MNTLSGRMAFAVLVINAVLLPALYFRVESIMRSGQQETFVDHVRMYARIFADVLETSGTFESDDLIARQLDSAVLGGRTIFAGIVVNGRNILSTLVDDETSLRFQEDFEFGQHGDNIYYISVPLELNGSTASLQLGFDETPTLQQIESVRKNISYILLIYLLVSLLLVIIFSVILARPLQQLRHDSRKVASGDYSRQLAVSSHIREIGELTRDLEIMRSKLVGVNARLRNEIAERQAAEEKQQNLEARLRHAQRLESIGTLAGGIAHEFNNVLLPLILYTELALEDIGDDIPASDSLKKVLRLGHRAKGLSQQILTFSHQAGDTEKVATDIAPIVEEAYTLVRALVPATVDIHVDIKHNLGLVVCDATQIQQLVVNLCSNAFRSLRLGDGHIALELDSCDVTREFAEKHPRLRKGKYVCLSVSDTGSGMDSDTIQRVFEPFYTTREVGEGTGLGLSVVHGIVLRHDGEIVVSSTPGEGSVFKVYIPLAGRQVTEKCQIPGGAHE